MSAEHRLGKYTELGASPVTGDPLITHKTLLFEEVNNLVDATYQNHELASLIKFAESLGMDPVTSRRATNEALRLFIARQQGWVR